jgi:hypothetical protein
MELYLIATKALGEFYVVDTDPTSAAEKLGSLLSKSDYGHYGSREITNIKILGKELSNFPEEKPNFSSGHNFILPTSCE